MGTPDAPKCACALAQGWERVPVARGTAGSVAAHLRRLSCRFYIESISYLKDNATIELFFLNAKSCIYKVRSPLPALSPRDPRI